MGLVLCSTLDDLALCRVFHSGPENVVVRAVFYTHYGCSRYNPLLTPATFPGPVSKGVYFGWAALEGAANKEGEGDDEGDASGGGGEGGEGPWKCVANVGYSPTFAGQENAEKIVEGHLIGYEGACACRALLLSVTFCLCPVSDDANLLLFVVRFLLILANSGASSSGFLRVLVVGVFFLQARISTAGP